MGQGLLEIVKGAYDALLGKEITPMIDTSEGTTTTGINVERFALEDIKFGYCTEFIIMVEKEYNANTEMDFKKYLESIGDSIVVVSDDDIVKVHVHTNDPGLAIQKGLTYGSLTNMKIDNMREEHNEMLIKDAQKAAKEAEASENKPAMEKPRKKAGFIAVSMGEGLGEIFTGLGVDCIIEGGQTMNPSTEDMLNAISEVNADTIFILPNNSNIILTAEQAKQLTEDKNIVVIPSKNSTGITAVINYVYDKSPEANAERMTSEMMKVKSDR